MKSPTKMITVTNRYNADVHVRLVAEFISVHKVAHSAMFNDDYRALQSFYCIGEKIVKENGFLLNATKIRNFILPSRTAEGKKRQKKIIL